MNERIKLLAEQSGYGTRWTTTEQFEQFMEKFAELIVKRCATIADFAHLGGVIEPGVMVKEYFGVESD